jgi:hypothetical protein
LRWSGVASRGRLAGKTIPVVENGDAAKRRAGRGKVGEEDAVQDKNEDVERADRERERVQRLEEVRAGQRQAELVRRQREVNTRERTTHMDAPTTGTQSLLAASAPRIVAPPVTEIGISLATTKTSINLIVKDADEEYDSDSGLTTEEIQAKVLKQLQQIDEYDEIIRASVERKKGTTVIRLPDQALRQSVRPALSSVKVPEELSFILNYRMCSA